MAVKRTIHQTCQTCGEQAAFLRDGYVHWPLCRCAKQGPVPSPPTRVPASEVIFIADPTPPGEPQTTDDAGKMVAVGEGRDLPDAPGVWERPEDAATFDTVVRVAEYQGRLVCINGPRRDVKLLPRGNWHPTTTAETERLRGECERLRQELASASTHVEGEIAMRTKFTGNPPYVGWQGLGLALTEALDERDSLREQLAAAERERDQLKQADTATRHRLLSDPDLPKRKYASVTEMVADIAARERDDAEAYLTELGVPEFNEADEALSLKDRITRLRAELAAAEQRTERILQNNTPWPLSSALETLIRAAKHLLDDHMCDQHGYEQVRHAMVTAELTIAALSVKGGA